MKEGGDMNRAGRIRRVLWACMGLAAISPVSAAKVAAAPSRIVDGWYAHNATLVMLGAADRIVGTVVSPRRFAWMYCLAPSLYGARLFESMTLNGEAVLALHPDLVFVTRDSGIAPALTRLGLDAIPVGFNDFAGLLSTIDQTADRLDTLEAKQQAARYRAALTALLARRPPEGAGPRRKVLHIASLTPLTVDGEQSIVDEWIRDAGGTNAAIGIHGNKRPVSLEQILAWQPDVIVLGADAGRLDAIQTDPLWSGLAAVRERHVFRNPSGIFNWDRYSPELLLQIVWARQIIRSGTIDREAMIGQIRDFYTRFYRSPLGSKAAGRILDAAPPPPEACRSLAW